MFFKDKNRKEKRVFIGDIKTASPFRDLFPMSDKLVKEIYWDMQKNGFDQSKPIVLWESHGAVVIDGHTRLRAANKVGFIQVPVVLKKFDTEEEALEYAIKCQRNRRNLTDREIVKCVDELDKRRTRGGNHGNQYTKEKVAKVTPVTFGKSSVETGKLLGIGRGKVEKARVVLEEASDEVKEAVRSGQMSINSAYNKTRNLEKGSRESLELAAEEIASVEKIIDIINERLNKEQIRELIKRLALNFTEKFENEDESNG
jgi:ParB family chromosome partitioning protein